MKPFPDGVNCDVEPRGSADERNGLRPSDLVIGAVVLAPVAVKVAKEVRETVNGESQRDSDAA